VGKEGAGERSPGPARTPRRLSALPRPRQVRVGKEGAGKGKGEGIAREEGAAQGLAEEEAAAVGDLQP